MGAALLSAAKRTPFSKRDDDIWPKMPRNFSLSCGDIPPFVGAFPFVFIEEVCFEGVFSKGKEEKSFTTIRKKFLKQCFF